jgi:hypothetical protein
MPSQNDITTTKGERFTYDDSADLAWMVWRRFGRDLTAATAAWNRLLGNNCDATQFDRLVEHSQLNDEEDDAKPLHCPGCDGDHA